MAQKKRQVSMPDSLWHDIQTEALRERISAAELVKQASRFRVAYAAASRRAGSADPVKVFEADPRLLDDLRRWCNDG